MFRPIGSALRALKLDGIKVNDEKGCEGDPSVLGTRVQHQALEGEFMRNFETTIESPKSFDDTVKSIEQKASEKGFRVLHTHDVAATLAEKGFQRDPLKIIEICNACYASAVLERDVRVSLMLPCPISVYMQEGKTLVSVLLPSRIADFFPGAGMEQIANEVEEAVLAIISQATNTEGVSERPDNQRSDENASSRMAGEDSPNAPDAVLPEGMKSSAKTAI
jgi:uncharacterized protein (DUF302 family)